MVKEALEQRRARQKRYVAKHGVEKIREQCRKANHTYRQKHPDWKQRNERKQTLKGGGATVDKYDLQFKKQKGVCAICGEEETHRNQYGDCPLGVDHNHLTGKMRGLLCSRCNAGLGQFRCDSKKSELLIKAIEYLAQYPE